MTYIFPFDSSKEKFSTLSLSLGRMEIPKTTKKTKALRSYTYILYLYFFFGFVHLSWPHAGSVTASASAWTPAPSGTANQYAFFFDDVLSEGERMSDSKVVIISCPLARTRPVPVARRQFTLGRHLRLLFCLVILHYPESYYPSSSNPKVADAGLASEVDRLSSSTTRSCRRGTTG